MLASQGFIVAGRSLWRRKRRPECVMRRSLQFSTGIGAAQIPKERD